MLAQRETQWTSEQQAASNVIELLESDTGYRTLTNVISNYLWMTILIWGYEQESHQSLINKALRTERNLSIWGDSDSTLDTIDMWVSRGRKWNISELSQLMRIFVVVVEVIDANMKDTTLSTFNRVLPENLKIMLLSSQNYQFLGQGLKRFKSNYKLISFAEKINDDEYPDVQITRWRAFVSKIKSVTEFVPVSNPNLRLFKKRDNTNENGISPAGPRSRKSVYTVRDRLLGLDNDDVDSKRRLARMLSNSSSGTSLHSIQPDSLVGALEWIYGLPGGADTSGTTAEVFGVCWALSDYLPEEELNSMSSKAPWYLGPALAIVRNTHHTYLECAIAIYAGELLKNKKTMSYIPGKYHTILDTSMFTVPGVGATVSPDDPLLERVYKKLYDAQVGQSRYLFSPSPDSWSSAENNQISILGGTISNGYSYTAVTQDQIDKLDIKKLINIGAAVLKQPISQTTSSTVIDLQLKGIYNTIISEMR